MTKYIIPALTSLAFAAAGVWLHSPRQKMLSAIQAMHPGAQIRIISATPCTSAAPDSLDLKIAAERFDYYGRLLLAFIGTGADATVSELRDSVTLYGDAGAAYRNSLDTMRREPGFVLCQYTVRRHIGAAEQLDAFTSILDPGFRVIYYR